MPMSYLSATSYQLSFKILKMAAQCLARGPKPSEVPKHMQKKKKMILYHIVLNYFNKISDTILLLSQFYVLASIFSGGFFFFSPFLNGITYIKKSPYPCALE